MASSEISFKKEKPPKESNSSKDDTSWILEGIVAYIKSPTWVVPVMNFVEEHCGVFINSEENMLEYTELHGKYKNLVEGLLFEYMKQLELTETQFSQACSKKKRKIAQFEGMEYIWAADDFVLFKRLMLQKNLEVEMEALNMMKQESKDKTSTEHENDLDVELLNESLKKSSSLKMARKKEEDDLRQAIQFSKMEMERFQQIAYEEKRMLDEAIKLSLQTSPSIHENNEFLENYREPQIPAGIVTQQKNNSTATFPDPTEFVEDEVYDLNKDIKRRNSSSHNKDLSNADAANEWLNDAMKGHTKSPEPLKNTKIHNHEKDQRIPDLGLHLDNREISSSEAANAWLENATKEITSYREPSLLSSNSKQYVQKQGAIDPKEMEKRRWYLQEQREKLLKIKRDQREKELSKYEGKKQDVKQASLKNSEEPEKRKEMDSRRAVAQRLKQEVINKK